MLSISHAVTGAFIATKINNPFIAVPLILISHYAQDAISHWDVGTGLGKGLKSPKSAFLHELVDLALAGILVILMFHVQFNVPYSIFNILSSAPIWGAFIGLLPDFLEAPRNFFKYEPSWLKPINKFHGSFHHSIPRILDGLAPQILLLIILYILK